MIFDSIDNRERYADHPGLAEALDVLASLDADRLPAGPVRLAGDAGHVGFAHLTSRDPDEVKFEAHQVFADVHTVLAGEERLEAAALADLADDTPYDEDQDISFHAGAADVSFRLRPGWFAVVFPGEAHRPGLWVDGPVAVTKVVAKVRIG